jgi:hypothetical protein
MNCIEQDCTIKPVLQVENIETNEVLCYACSLPHLATFMSETKDLGTDRCVKLIPIVN